MATPNNNQAPTTNYDQAYASFGSVYDPEVQQVQGQQAQLLQDKNTALNQLGQDNTTKLSQLDQAKKNAFSTNTLNSNARGLFYSGYAPQQNDSYTNNVYNPNVQAQNTNYQRGVDDTNNTYAKNNQTLQQKIADLNQQRANDANSLVQSTRQAQLAAATSGSGGSRSRGGGSSGGSSRSSGKSGSKGSTPFDLTTISAPTLTRQLTVRLRGVEGGDGHVNPQDLAKAFNTWRSAGLTPAAFWKNFQGVWNPNQKSYKDEFNYWVSKGV